MLLPQLKSCNRTAHFQENSISPIVEVLGNWRMGEGFARAIIHLAAAQLRGFEFQLEILEMEGTIQNRRYFVPQILCC